jgi:hypothetical protein
MGSPHPQHIARVASPSSGGGWVGCHQHSSHGSLLHGMGSYPSSCLGREGRVAPTFFNFFCNYFRKKKISSRVGSVENGKNDLFEKQVKPIELITKIKYPNGDLMLI